MSPNSLTNFSRCSLTGCIMVWYCNSNRITRGCREWWIQPCPFQPSSAQFSPPSIVLPQEGGVFHQETHHPGSALLLLPPSGMRQIILKHNTIRFRDTHHVVELTHTTPNLTSNYSMDLHLLHYYVLIFYLYFSVISDLSSLFLFTILQNICVIYILHGVYV